ncbi:hypothetical protein Holit_01620 [Hollandina sp. SP2]
MRGVKGEDSKRGHKFPRVTVVAGVIHGKKETKKIAPECYSGTMTGDHFERWFEYKLLNEVERGSVIIMDRASFHRNSLEKYAGRIK